MQIINWTEKKNKWGRFKRDRKKKPNINRYFKGTAMMRQPLKHSDELRSLLTEGVVEGTGSRGRPRMGYNKAKQWNTLLIKNWRTWQTTKKHKEIIKRKPVFELIWKKKKNVLHKI